MIIKLLEEARYSRRKKEIIEMGEMIINSINEKYRSATLLAAFSFPPSHVLRYRSFDYIQVAKNKELI